MQPYILLIDNDLREAEFILMIWEKVSPYTSFEIARSGKEAIEFLQAEGAYNYRFPADMEPPQLILLSSSLSDMNHLEWLNLFKTKTPLQTIPVIGIVDEGNVSLVSESYKQGIRGHFLKYDDKLTFAQSIVDFALHWYRAHQPYSQVKSQSLNEAANYVGSVTNRNAPGTAR